MKKSVIRYLGAALAVSCGLQLDAASPYNLQYLPQQNTDVLIRLDDGFLQERDENFGIYEMSGFQSGGGTYSQADAVSRIDGSVGVSTYAGGSSGAGGSSFASARTLTKIEVTSDILAIGHTFTANINFQFDGEITLTVANDPDSSETSAFVSAGAGYELLFFETNPIFGSPRLVNEYIGGIDVGFRPEGTPSDAMAGPSVFYNNSDYAGATVSVDPLTPVGITLGEGGALAVNGYTVTGSLNVDLTVGDTYYLQQILSSHASGDGGENLGTAKSDFYNTGEFTFSDPNGLAEFESTQVTAVPEPNAIGLSMMTLLIALARRKAR